jgi:hypothetical protein
MQDAQNSALPPKVLYLPNEGSLLVEEGQVGGRAAFNEMAQDGTIRELKIYSFLAEYNARQKNAGESHRELLEVVKGFQPDVIFWQHPYGYPISDDLLSAIRGCGSAPLLAFHEGDPFDRYYKIISSELETLYRNCDVFFTIGLGEAQRLFNRIRVHPHFYFSPSIFDRERVGTEPPRLETLGSRYDAVMIGTIGTRIRGFYMQPYSKMRIKLAREMVRIFGDRFAVFGGGWPADVNCAGLLHYSKQAATIQTSRMSLMWDLYPEYTFYFSDRLPIALGSGVPFVTNRRKGFDVVLAGAPGLYLGDTIEDLVDIAVYLRGLPLEEIHAIGLAEREWAFANLEVRVVFRKAFDICLRVLKEKRGSL